MYLRRCCRMTVRCMPCARGSTPGPVSGTSLWAWPDRARSSAHAIRREGLAGDLLYDGVGALPYQRDGYVPLSSRLPRPRRMSCPKGERLGPGLYEHMGPTFFLT